LPRYTIYQQEVSLPDYLNNCIFSPGAKINGGINPDGSHGLKPSDPCFLDGEASLPVRRELAAGPVVASILGYTLAYNTLDNNKNPTSGLYWDIKQDFAGVGGDVSFIRTTTDLRHYYEVYPDVISLIHLQAGHLGSWGSKDLRMLDHFQMGPQLVRGFEPSGFGPRDLSPGSTNDSLGGTLYWGSSVEFQTPLFFLPKEVGMKFATFADAGSLWDYRGPTSWNVTGEHLTYRDSAAIRSSVGVGIIWDSPFGPLRFDFAFPITKRDYDRTQWFRFGGSTKF
jgi:outer membrane protein insertion porin family